MKVSILKVRLTTGMFSAFAAFLDDGDEVIIMEPYFDQVPNYATKLNVSTFPILR